MFSIKKLELLSKREYNGLTWSPEGIAHVQDIFVAGMLCMDVYIPSSTYRCSIGIQPLGSGKCLLGD